MKMINVPRQARDKHGKVLKKDPVYHSAKLAGRTLAGFCSNFESATFMQPIPGGVKVGSDGSFEIAVAVDDLITLTTTRPAGQAPPPLPPPPADSPMPTVFQDTFESYTGEKQTPEISFFPSQFSILNFAMKHGDQSTLPRQAWDQKAQARLKNRRWCFGTVGSEAKL
jgi:hypothetical protein